MSSIFAAKVGDRIELLQQMENGPSSVIPVETGMHRGLQGTVVFTPEGVDDPSWAVLGVRWDNGRSLGVTARDFFRLIQSEEEDVEEEV